MISFRAVSRNKFAQETCKKKLRTDNHRNQSNVKQRSLRHPGLVKKEFSNGEVKNNNKSEKEKRCSP